ncbi:MAG: hypothetical protein U0T36_11725 [Saprospiraceae bacterium]
MCGCSNVQPKGNKDESGTPKAQQTLRLMIFVVGFTNVLTQWNIAALNIYHHKVVPMNHYVCY